MMCYMCHSSKQTERESHFFRHSNQVSLLRRIVPTTFCASLSFKQIFAFSDTTRIYKFESN